MTWADIIGWALTITSVLMFGCGVGCMFESKARTGGILLLHNALLGLVAAGVLDRVVAIQKACSP